MCSFFAGSPCCRSCPRISRRRIPPLGTLAAVWVPPFPIPQVFALHRRGAYDEFSAWIENETENIQKLVDAGEWTEAEATEALEYYDEILKSILEGKMVGKRASSSDDQLFFSMPDNAQPEQYQTFVFDGNTYKSIGPFDTEEELFNALKEYTNTEVEAGTMSQAEATALLEKYQ